MLYKTMTTILIILFAGWRITKLLYNHAPLIDVWLLKLNPDRDAERVQVSDFPFHEMRRKFRFWFWIFFFLIGAMSLVIFVFRLNVQ
jgi:hypothetical protein